MIDIVKVLSAASWILGLAIILTVLSFARYSSIQEGVKMSELLRKRSYYLALGGGSILVCVGFAASDSRWWGKILWLALALAVSIRTFRFGQSADSEV